MKKKILLLLLVFILACSLVACGNGEEENGTDDPGQTNSDQNGDEDESGSTFGDLQSAAFAEMMQGGNYYMEYTMNVMGIEMEATQAVRGADTDSRATIMGLETRTIVLDGVQYTMDETAKTYYKTESTAADYDYAQLQYRESGNGKIESLYSEEELANAPSYDYDEYFLPIDLADAGVEGLSGEGELVLRYYMNDDGSLYAINMDIEGIETVLVVKSMTTDIPAGMFEIPRDYTEVEEPVY